MSRDERILQRKLSCQIRRIDGFIKTVDSIIEAGETVRLEIMGEELKEIKEKIEKLYDELFSLDEVDIDKESEAYDSSMNKIGSLRVKIENKRKLKDKLADIKPNGSQANIKLPQFDLPIYDGDMGTWINFKELFLTTIDAHPGLTNIQKLQYLNSAVKGEAARLIRGFPLLSENYGQALNTLLSRYDNPRELAYAQVSKFFSLRAIKNPSAKCLHEFMDVCNEAIRNLETLELKRNQFVDVILVHFLQQKLSENLRLDWELSVDNTLPSYDKFIAFISRHARSMSCAVKECSKKEETTGSRFPKCQSYGMLIESSDTCILCKSKHHPLYMCNLFCKMPLKEKLNVVKSHKLCFNCLRKGHFSWNCRLNQRCKVCKGKHHTMIHYDKPSTEGASAQVENTTPKEHESAINLTNTQQANCNDSHVLLATAGIKIQNGLGKLCTCRALLDSGSQVTMITKGCCERLGLVQRKSDRMIIGVGNTPVQNSSSTVSVTFCPLNNSEEFSVEAVVTGVLTSEIPNFRLKDPNWPTLKNLKLADPEFYIQAPIDMILGADIYTELMLNGPISLGEGLPMAINTRLGWVLLGKLMGTSESNTEVCNLSLQSEPELEFVMKRFWETESVPSPDLCTQDEDCESLFSNNHGRDSHGRYWVKLPFRQHRPLLGESREKALRRFLLLERKLCKNVKLYDQYRGFLKEYEHLNHMERVPIAEVKRELCRCYYMPHHPVIREQSTTTKMRVVFDVSAKSENNVSLNQFLHKGPKIQQDVFFILLRFRTYPVAITADIEKMYRQIRIHPEDADYQRILWRPSPEEPVVDYRLLTVTYGTTSAPFLAMRTLQQLAEDEGQNYPEASRVTLNDFYVDDLLTGAQTIAETKELIDQLKDLMKKGGFHLRKWNSNCHEIVSHVEEINDEKKINLEKGAISKILGIVWDHVQDTFRVNITLPEEVVTKRDLLSNIARIFDPIGFLSPTTVALKIIMQELWRGGTGWDEHIPNDIKEKWNNFRAELLKLEDLSIPRYVWACEKDRDVQLHGFCDASSVAYSAVCYLRTVSLDGQVHISMLAAKTRVAPCKSLTLPRLELCAALLLSQLYRSVVDSLKIDIGRTYLWSDSQISLSWIKSDPNRWKTFIHNRVVKIQQLSDRNSWRHVSGKDNPADCASRGIMPAALSGHTLWWQGPTWLKDNNFVQNQDNCYGRECHEEEKVALACQSRVSVCPEVVTKYSTFIKTRRIIAWCLRFITNCRVSLKKREIGTLSKKELENAVIRIIGWIQEDEFGEEMQDLRNTGHASRKSRILQLNPFIYASGMLRAGGRIKFANIAFILAQRLALLTDNAIADKERTGVSQERTKIKTFGKALMFSFLFAPDEDKSFLSKRRGSRHAGLPTPSPPTFEGPPSGGRFVEGGDAHFECRVRGSPQPEVVWSRRGMPIRNDNRRQVSYDPSTGLCTFHIKGLTAEDDGEYTCTAVNVAGEASLTVSIQREIQGLTQVRREQRTDVRREHRSTTFMERTVDGYYQRSISSEYNGSDVSAPQYYSGVESFRVDTFEYRLLREIEFRDTLTRRQVGEVEHQYVVDRTRPVAAPQIAQRPRNSKLLEGTDATFQAAVPANPPPKITWFRNGQRLPPESPRHRTSYDAVRGVATLQLLGAQPEDAGYYTLLAENPSGRVATSSHLVIEGQVDGKLTTQGPPVTPTPKM
ncbi:hypothetical protein LAZ67_23001768 [Cordylochernes scorpioides]|uniref:Gag-pol polyprotein n=1 Tax=Cordylochernes scorpioides TaxID=51811 RepID=A0ABY6LTG2_9ARAC|nr:hypothetical protein LAZ67_23001768 [Cordylochernes scorpioides]